MNRLRSTLLALAASLGMGLSARADILYVSDVGSRSVKEIDTKTGAVISSMSGPNLITPNAITFDNAGNLYVSDLTNRTVLKYDDSSKTFNTFVAQNSGGLAYPFTISFGPDNNLYVANYSGNSGDIQRYDGTTGASLGTFASAPGLSQPTGMVFSGNTLYVSSSGNDSIYAFNSLTGANQSPSSKALILPDTGAITNPAGLAVGLDGKLYVASFNNTPSGIARYDTTTGAFIDYYNGVTNLNGPTGPVFGSDGVLYTASNRNNAIYAITPSGNVSAIPLGITLDGPNYIAIRGNSGQAVPEPASLILLGVGGLAWAFRSRLNRFGRRAPEL